MKNFYVYKIIDIVTNEYYIGSRGCKCKIELDDYMGSPYIWKPNKKNLEKIILFSGFKTKEDAVFKERELIISEINNPLNRNYSIPHPKWNRDGKITGKNIDGKIVSISIYDPLFNKTIFGVTKGLVTVRDKEGNIFQTDVNNPKYINGELSHVAKGVMVGDKHPLKNKIWINNGNKQIPVSKEDVKKYIENGWNLGTLQKGKTTSSSHVGTCWVHNESLNKTKRINKFELEKYIENGWKPNRLKLGKYKK